MSRAGWILAAAAVALAALLGWSLHREYAWVREDTWAGYQGEARRNPFLAAQRLLERTGHPARSLDRLPDPLPPVTDVLILARRGDPGNAREAARIARWVRAGGLLVAAGAPPEGYGRVRDALFQQFGAAVAGIAPDPTLSRPITLDGRTLTVDLGERSRISDPGTPAGAALLERPLGAGAAILCADLDGLANNRITRYDHADLLCAVAARRPGAAVWLVIRGDAPGLWAWLARHAGPALASLAVLALAAAWTVAPRFGPLLPAPGPARRSFLEHLDATGRYQWRAGQGRALLDASRAAFRQRLVRARPAWAALDPDPLARRLAEHTGLPRERIDLALHHPARHPAEFLDAIRTLRTLGSHL